jgi:hypothetical protein
VAEAMACATGDRQADASNLSHEQTNETNIQRPMKPTYNDLTTAVLTWATARNIIGDNAKGTPFAQLKKTMEEVNETRDALVFADAAQRMTGQVSSAELNEIKDGIGDVVVTLIIGGQMQQMIPQPDMELTTDKSNLVLMDEVAGYVLEAAPLLKTNTELAVTQIVDNFRSILFRLKLIASRFGWTLEECLEAAWDEIKDRQGKMVNGEFVREKTEVKP